MTANSIVPYRALCVLAMAMAFGTPAQAQYVLTDGTEVASLETFRECEHCPEMIVLPMGSFQMGAPEGDSRWEVLTAEGDIAYIDLGEDERPVHEVEIDIPIAMGRNEVTWDQWMACVEGGGCNGYVPRNDVLGNPAYYGDDNRVFLGGSVPVFYVSYLDALSYVAWLNAQVGEDVYRLPTEAEWEYAARAGTQTRFAQGDTLTFEQANFNAMDEDGPRPQVPFPVEMLDAANAWGLRHMSGNIAEWTMSCFTEGYAGWATSSEYLRQSENVTCRRVARGGGAAGAMDFARVAARGHAEESERPRVGGFRIVRVLN